MVRDTDGRALPAAVRMIVMWMRPSMFCGGTRRMGDVHRPMLLDRAEDRCQPRLARRLETPLLYVAAGGFSDRFRQAALASREEVYLWTLGDLYAEMS